jgi:hypothetical protein
MMGSSPVADTGSVDRVFALLSAVSDPKAAKAALSQLAEAQKQADAKLAASNAALADIAKREDAIGVREKAVVAGEGKLAKAIQKQKDYEAATNADLESRIAAVTAREIAVSKVDNANAERELAVSNREAAIAAKEANLQAAFDKAAATQREYDEKLAALRSLAGA